ncbi:MAG: hypothetical protein V1772_09360 [Chloroflexota bacterium]
MDTWASPVLGFVVFAALALGLHRLGARWAPRGADSLGKHLPYACGEDLMPGEKQLSYGRYFRLALMFVAVHVAALVVALLPSALGGRLLATAYLVGAMVCMHILVADGNEQHE